MRKLRRPIHAPEHIWLRELFTKRRKELGLSQRALAERLQVIHSLIGKIETGDRRLDLHEFLHYCRVLELEPRVVLKQLIALVEQNMETALEDADDDIEAV